LDFLRDLFVIIFVIFVFFCDFFFLLLFQRKVYEIFSNTLPLDPNNKGRTSNACAKPLAFWRYFSSYLHPLCFI